MSTRALAAVALVLLAGCSSSAGTVGRSAPRKTTPRSAITRATAASAPCAGYKPDSVGVVRTFCDGPGSATIVDGGTSYSVIGGSCASSAGNLTFTAGVVTSANFAGARPDYVGLIASGGGAAAVVALVYGGAPHPLIRPAITVEPGQKSGTFAGTSRHGTRVSGGFACGA